MSAGEGKTSRAHGALNNQSSTYTDENDPVYPVSLSNRQMNVEQN